MWTPFFLLTFLIFSSPHLAETDISTVQVDSAPTKSAAELVKQSGLIVFGQIEGMEAHPTSRRVVDGTLVNYVQTILVQKTLKGASQRTLKLLITGVEPLPKPSNPLNLIYPGPLAEGSYVFFLRPVPGTQLYSLVGIWQGVYPLFKGKTVALKGSGYPEFNGLSVEQLTETIRSFNR